MSFFYGLSPDEFPFTDLPNTPEQYYERVRHYFWRKKKKVVQNRKTLIVASKLDEDFSDFWESYRETHPDSEEYLSSLLDATQPFNNAKITTEYDAFLQARKVSDFSKSARKKLQSEFNAIRPTLYQSFLETEAFRLNCDVSEVRSRVPVLPLEEDRGQSKLCSLPDDIFTKIMARLEVIEIFQMTQVCRKWRQIVYQTASVLTRAEHSLPTHLLTFTNWMDPWNVVTDIHFRMHYRSCGLSLIKWCCNISQNLEALVLTELSCSHDEFMSLLRQCPNLKHLHFKFYGIEKRCETDIHLPKLESLIAERSNVRRKRKTVIDVYKNSRCFRVFKGKLTIGDITLVKAKGRKQNAFANLTALQLVTVCPRLLAKLDTLDQLPLRYLCLGDRINVLLHSARAHTTMIDEGNEAFHRLLSRLDQLEVLVAMWTVDVNVKTIRLMTKRQRNLKSALLGFRVTSLDNEEGFDSNDGRDNVDHQAALVSFEDMLLEKDPSRDLSAFEFIVKDKRSRSFLQNAETGFSIDIMNAERYVTPGKWSLSHPSMRRQLGIDF